MHARLAGLSFRPPARARAVGRRVADAGRSATARPAVRLKLDITTGWLWWGGTWSVVCGAAAAWSGDWSWSMLARLASAWFVSVPLMGSLWTDAADARVGKATDAPDRPSAWPAAAVAGGCAVALAASLSTAVGWLVLLAVAVAWALRHARLAAIGRSGAVRSGYEVLVPGLVAWLALDGAIPAPAAQAVAEGTAWAVSRWLTSNASLPVLLLGFALVHHGTTAALDRRHLDRRWWEIVGGYLLAIAVLVANGRAPWAALVGLLFVVQWPLQSAMRSGRVLWHLRRVQWLSLAAMLAASAAV